MLRCPACGTPEVRVVQTALRSDGSRWRRRRCTDCEHRWSEREGLQTPKRPRPALTGQSAYEHRRLTDWQAAEILLSRDNERALAQRYGISRASVNAIRRGTAYRNVWEHLQQLRRPGDEPYSPP